MMVKIPLRHAAVGFTLAELLIALAILGVIAVFTIPKILNAQQDGKRVAIFKETIAALSEAFYGGWRQGEVTESNFGTYMVDHLNAIKQCTDSAAEGCWPSDSDLIGNNNSGYPGIVLHNGAQVAGFDNINAGLGYDYILVDWNGAEGPNLEGEDEMILKVVFAAAGGNRVGSIHGYSGKPVSLALWYEVFE